MDRWLDGCLDGWLDGPVEGLIRWKLIRREMIIYDYYDYFSECTVIVSLFVISLINYFLSL